MDLDMLDRLALWSRRCVAEFVECFGVGYVRGDDMHFMTVGSHGFAQAAAVGLSSSDSGGVGVWGMNDAHRESNRDEATTEHYDDTTVCI